MRSLAGVGVSPTFPYGYPRMQKLVAADLPAFQPVEKAHPEQIGSQLARLCDQGRHRALGDAADRQPVERDRRRARPTVRGIDIARNS